MLLNSGPTLDLPKSILSLFFSLIFFTINSHTLDLQRSLHLENGIAALFHEPAGGGGGTADADGVDALEPLWLYLLGILDEVGVGIHAQTLVVEYLAVRALAATDEEDEVVLGGKLRDVGHAVGHGAADGVETLEGGLGGDVRLDIIDDAMELVERLRGLTVEVDIAREVEALHLVEALDDDGGRLGLTYEAEYLGVAFLAEDDDLGDPTPTPPLEREGNIVGFIELFLDALLELKHHGAGGIDNLDVVTSGELIGLRGFAMGAQQHLHIVELAHLFVVDGDEPHRAEAFTLHAVVDDIAETIEFGTLGKFFLGLFNGGGHSEAEATAFIDFYYHRKIDN